jgi:hypothetical protein
VSASGASARAVLGARAGSGAKAASAGNGGAVSYGRAVSGPVRLSARLSVGSIASAASTEKISVWSRFKCSAPYRKKIGTRMVADGATRVKAINFVNLLIRLYFLFIFVYKLIVWLLAHMKTRWYRSYFG